MAFLAVGVGLYALSNFFFAPLKFSKGDLAEDPIWLTFFHIHFIGGAIALSIGWSQFWQKLRKNRLKLHRWLGKIYVISICLVGSVGGAYLAIFANGGFANQLGFMSLNVLWFITTLLAYQTIKKKKVTAHKHWMIYSYALTYAAVTLRIFWPFWEFGLGIPNEEAYAAIAWFCWVPNLIFAQILINKGWVKD